ncbi:O-methyltransferase [Roridomyces roridus]|uniref:O-methyltransferase n=1 Tax=Roridomyces roridus TaxID=1738132 RepID=A0AAD7BGY9_9AGAR|nr:O-methyltransferase [Roridomyces roridus]
MTFATLRALEAILHDALDDIQAVYADARPTHATTTSPGPAYASPPPSPGAPPLDFPCLDAPCDPSSPSEQLTTHPTVAAAINRVLASTAHIAAIVQPPFLALCDAAMGYHLPSCLRLFEAAHVAEALRAGPLHVSVLAPRVGVPERTLAHVLRLLATHHYVREMSPDVFAVNRISSLVDTGQPFEELVADPTRKYAGDGGAVPAFVGLCADELYKSSAYLTEAVFPACPTTSILSSSDQGNIGQGTSSSSDPTRAPFNHAFGCAGVGYFAWLEGEGCAGKEVAKNPNRFRLERFGRFDWTSLPRGSTVVDVGGGIGSTTMVLATACADELGLRFVVQDRPPVVAMGEEAWKAKCPEMIEEGKVRFQVHDFFEAQPQPQAIPSSDAPAVFLLRVVLHDWPDAFAQRILLRLREAAGPTTKLLIAEWVLPLACVDDTAVEGAQGVVGEAEGPLLANLGRASANVYWMDLTMQVTFNGQERTLKEIISLAASAGWKVVRVTHAPGSLFGYVVAEPVAVPLPAQRRARAGSGSAFFDSVPSATGSGAARSGADREMERGVMERASSRCGTPTFGSRVVLPSAAETKARFGVDARRGRNVPLPQMLKPAPTLVRKKKPSPLSVLPPSPNVHRSVASPRPSQQQQSSPVARRMSQAPPFLRSAAAPAPAPPPSPLSPLSRSTSTLRHVPSSPGLKARQHPPNLSSPPSPTLPSPTPPPQTQRRRTLRHMPSSPVLKQPMQHMATLNDQSSPPSPVPSRIPALVRRASHAQLILPQTELRKRSGSIIHPAMVRAAAGSGLGLRGSGGGSLDFGRARRRQGGDGDGEWSADDDNASLGLGLSRRASPVPMPPGGSVLAAAARIE